MNVAVRLGVLSGSVLFFYFFVCLIFCLFFVIVVVFFPLIIMKVRKVKVGAQYQIML